MNKLLKGLKLRPQIGGFVESFTFKNETRSALGQWLDDNAIQRLQSRLEVAIEMERDRGDEPTLGDNRAVLERIQALAGALSTAIDQAPQTAQCELTRIGHSAFYDPFKLDQLAIDLKTVEINVAWLVEKMPKQSRRQSHIQMTKCIADVAASQGIKVSEVEKSRFHKLCKCVFESVGIFTDVRGSIRAHLAEGHNR